MFQASGASAFSAAAPAVSGFGQAPAAAPAPAAPSGGGGFAAPGVAKPPAALTPGTEPITATLSRPPAVPAFGKSPSAFGATTPASAPSPFAAPAPAPAAATPATVPAAPPAAVVPAPPAAAPTPSPFAAPAVPGAAPKRPFGNAVPTVPAAPAVAGSSAFVADAAPTMSVFGKAIPPRPSTVPAAPSLPGTPGQAPAPATQPMPPPLPAPAKSAFVAAPSARPQDVPVPAPSSTPASVPATPGRSEASAFGAPPPQAAAPPPPQAAPTVAASAFGGATPAAAPASGSAFGAATAAPASAFGAVPVAQTPAASAFAAPALAAPAQEADVGDEMGGGDDDTFHDVVATSSAVPFAEPQSPPKPNVFGAAAPGGSAFGAAPPPTQGSPFGQGTPSFAAAPAAPSSGAAAFAAAPAASSGAAFGGAAFAASAFSNAPAPVGAVEPQTTGRGRDRDGKRGRDRGDADGEEGGNRGRGRGRGRGGDEGSSPKTGPASRAAALAAMMPLPGSGIVGTDAGLADEVKRSPRQRGRQGRGQNEGDGQQPEAQPLGGRQQRQAFNGGRGSGGGGGVSMANVSAVGVPSHLSGHVAGFILFCGKLVKGEVATAAQVLEQIRYNTKYAVASLGDILPHLASNVDQQRQGVTGREKEDALRVLSRDWAAIVGALMVVNHVESHVVAARPDNWAELLGEASAACDCAVTAFVSVVRSCPPHRCPFALIGPMLLQHRSFSDRLRGVEDSVGVLREAGARHSAAKHLFSTVSRALSGAADFTTSDIPPEAQVALGHCVAELSGGEGLEFVVKHSAFVDFLDTAHPHETLMRCAAHFRFGHRFLSFLELESAAKHLAKALVLCDDADNRVVVFEALAATQLARNRLPPQDLLDEIGLCPALEDVLLAVQSANLRLHDTVVEAHAVYLQQQGLLCAAHHCRASVVLNMVVKHYAAQVKRAAAEGADAEEVRRVQSQIDLDNFAAANDGQFAKGTDIAQQYILPLLYEQRIRGYLAGTTLVVSAKNPFPELGLDRLFPQ